jgi:PEP-CTERM motif
MKKLTLAALLVLASSSVFAGAISAADFSGRQTTVSLNGVGDQSVSSFNFGGLSFSATDSGSGGDSGWRDLTSEGYGYTDNTGISNITIGLNGAYQRVGLEVYIGPATYLVSFYDALSNLVGSESITLANTPAFAFVGWEFAGGISSINIFETIPDEGQVGGFNNIRFENAASSVPEPASLALLSLGFAGLGLSRRKKS